MSEIEGWWLTVSKKPRPARRGGATGKSAKTGTASSQAATIVLRSVR